MSQNHPSSLTLDLLHLGRLADLERERVQRHLDECEVCRIAVRQAEANREYFLSRIAPRGVPIHAPRRWWPAWLLVPAVAAAAIVLLWRPPSDELGIKGGPSLTSFVRHDGHVTPLRDGEAVHAGDELRFVTVSDTLPYLLVCSVDGAGKANIYYPFDSTESGRIALRKRVELPGSVVLDESSGPERLFALFSSRPIAADAAKRALESLGMTGAAGIRSARRLAITADAQLTIRFEKAQ